MPPNGSQSRKSALGALFLTGGIAVALLVFFLGDIVRLAQPKFELIALVPDAGALDHGSPVWIAGQPVGIVKEIQFRGAQTDSSTRLALVLEIPRKYATQIRRDAQVRLTSAMVIGNPVVDINPGSPTAPPVQDHDTLHVNPVGTLQGVMDRADSLTSRFEKLIADTRGFQRTAQRGSNRLTELQNNLAAVSGSFATFSKGMQHSAAHILSDPQVRTLLADVSRQNRQIQAMLANAQRRAGRSRTDLHPALKQLQARADTISRVISELQKRVTENGGGLLVRAQRDSAIVKALHGASLQLDSLMAETMRNPLRFWF